MCHRLVLSVLPLTLLSLLVASPATGEEFPTEPERQGAAAIPEPEELAALEPDTSHAPLPSAADPAQDRDPLEPDETLPAKPVTLLPQPPAPPPPLAPDPVIVNEGIQYFLECFQAPSRRAIIGRWLNRSGRYVEMIRNVFKEHGLPEELAYVAMIESGFNPAAVSRVGAKGLWQFMEQTARRYGLRVDRWVDERLDPEKSTLAAALYLRDLFHQFGSWFLAKAAYNAGELKVAEAVLRSGTRDFWSLTRGRVLRDETKRFVPAVLAATLIGQNPDRYGFEIIPESPLTYDLVTVPPLIGLERLAVRAGIPLPELQRLNPALRHGMTPPGSPYNLKVPSGSAAGIERALLDTRAAGPPRAVHMVRPRETLDRIAKRYRVSVAELVRWNGLSSPSRIFPGDRLRVAESR